MNRGSPPQDAKVAALTENARCCPQSKLGMEWGGRGVALGLRSPSECGRKKVEMGASQRDSLCISPWPLPLLPSPKLPLAPGSSTPAAETYFFPHLYFRVFPKIKNTEIKGEKGKTLY